MITYDTIEAVRVELGRCMQAVEALNKKLAGDPEMRRMLLVGVSPGCRESATLKRVSMDLSNALVDLRTTPKRAR